MIRIISSLAVALGILWAAMSAAWAHPWHDAAQGLRVVVLSALPLDPNTAEVDYTAPVADVVLSLQFQNHSAAPIILREARTLDGVTARVFHTVNFLGASLRRDIPFYQIDPQETRALIGPQAGVLVRDVSIEDLKFRSFMVVLDFGPHGQTEVMARVASRPHAQIGR